MGIYRPSRGSFSPCLQLPEPDSALAQRGREQCQLPSARPSASLRSAFSAAELSCNFPVTGQGRAQKSWAGRDSTPWEQGEPWALEILLPCTGAASSSCFSPGCLAAPVSHLAVWLLLLLTWLFGWWGFSGRKAYEHWEPLLSPNRKQPQHLEQSACSVQECNSEGTEWDRRNQEEFFSSGEQTVQVKSSEC